LIKTKHNSNHKPQQTTLEREIVQEYAYHSLGFVPAEGVRLKKRPWFSKMDREQIKYVEKFLVSKNMLRFKF